MDEPLESQNQIENPNPSASTRGRFVLVLIILGVAFSLYLIAASSRGLFPFSKEIAVSLTPTPTATPVPDEIANWKTYRNEEFGFEIRHPVDWQFKQYNDKSFLISNPASFFTVLIFYENNTQKLSLKDFVSQKVSDANSEDIGGIKYEREFSTTVGNDISAYELYGVFAYDQEDEYIYTANGDTIFRFSFPVPEENQNFSNPKQIPIDNQTAHQILSTLKFIEPNQSDQPCIQVVTTARNLQTGEIKDFPTPCDVPEGWQEI